MPRPSDPAPTLLRYGAIVLRRSALLLLAAAGCSDGEPPALDCGAQQGGCETRGYQELDGPLANPERGWFLVADITSDGDIGWVVDEGVSLVNARIHLDDYRQAPLPEPFLAELDAGFDRVRAAGLKAIVRFQYNDGSGDDASLAQLMAHIDQLAPLLAEHADVIATLQAGFIGAWGEWHSSSSGLDDDDARAAVAGALLEALPAERTIQLRTPEFKDTLFPGGPVDGAVAFTGDRRARVGHHNDCLLADESDNGTYADPVEQWRAYLAADGAYVPVGGEPCTVSSLLACDSTLAELERMHWSFLNGGHPEDVIAGWLTGGCVDDIGDRLGYRFVLEQSSWSAAPTTGGWLMVALELDNRGFTAPFGPREALIVLDGPSGRREVQLAGTTAADPRFWLPGTPVRVEAAVPLDGLPPGTYRLSLWMPDPSPALRARPAYAIRLASVGLWDAATGENVLEPALQILP